jgi:hypothetical protein
VSSQDDPTRGTELNGAGYGAGVLCTPAEGLFCDAQTQALWRDSLIAKTASRDISNNALVEGQVLYVLSDSSIYESGPWDRMALWGGVDGCVITGGSQAQPLDPAPGGNPDVPEVVAVQGGGSKTKNQNKLIAHASFLTLTFFW